MKPWLFPVLMLVGFLATVMIGSPWLPRMQADVLTSHYQFRPFLHGSADPPFNYVVPRQSLVGPDRHSDNLEDRLLAATINPDEKSLTRLQLLAEVDRSLEIARTLRTPEAIGTALRRAALIPSWWGDKPLDPYPKRLAQKAADLARLGSTLDPRNAFFPYLRAAFLIRLGEDPKEDLSRAALLDQFDDYALVEPRLRLDRMRAKHGARGEGVACYVESEVLLPHLSSLRFLTQAAADSGDPAQIGSLVHLAELMVDRGQSEIQVRVGMSLLYTLIDPEEKDFQRLNDLEDRVVVERAAALGKRIGAPDDTVDFAREVLRLRHSLPPDFVDPDALQQMLNLRPAFSAVALAVVALMFPVLGMAWLRSKWPKANAAAPFAVFGMAFSQSHAFENFHAAYPYFGILMALGGLALWPKGRRAAYALGYVAAVAMLVLSLQSVTLAIPAGGFLLAAILARRDQWPGWVVGGSAFAAATAGSIFLVAIAIRFDPPDVMVFGGWAVLCGAMIVPPFKSGWLAACGMASLLGLGWYAFDTFLQTESSARLVEVRYQLENGGETARQMARR